jgi:hypothetical protein
MTALAFGFELDEAQFNARCFRPVGENAAGTSQLLSKGISGLQ